MSRERRSRSPSSHRVFMGRLPRDARLRDLEDFFKDAGFSKAVRDITLKTGFAFIEFADYRDADDAVYELNHKDLLGTKIILDHAKPNRPGYGGGRREHGGGRRPSSRYGAPFNTDNRLIVENLSTRCGWQDLKDHFRQIGEVSFTKCHREKIGEGVVEFSSYRDMKTALSKLEGSTLYGKRIHLIDDSPAAKRGRSRSLSRSPRRRSPSPRSRSRSRSKSRSRSPARRAYSRSPSRSPKPRSPAGQED
ncbi:serine/arginine-rich splicing factor 4-like isoform X2 [Rhopilema esculentum]|uniref:serine/arginine-rich splicing factor 4-like isoform X2 n=1 Tax=Rhopilema esculentum TaxID=499914 RepID=UPI0031D434E1